MDNMTDKKLYLPGLVRNDTAIASERATTSICSGYTRQPIHNGAPDDQSTAVNVMKRASKLKT